MSHFVQVLVFGIVQVGSIYALIALGYTMVYGVLKLINFAHGDVYMLGWYFALMAIGAAGARAGHVQPSWLLFATAMVVSTLGAGLIGVIVERLAYRPLRAAPRLAALITAIGVSLFLENFAALPQVFGGTPKASPDIVPGGHPHYTIFALKAMAHPAVFGHRMAIPYDRWLVSRADIAIGGHAAAVFAVVIPRNYLIMFIATLLVLGLLWYIVSFTTLGRAMRAVSFDRDAASLMGVNANRVISFTFFLGSSLAGFGAFLSAVLVQNPVSPYSGIMPGLKAFTAAVLGGIGNIPGAAVGGFIIGLVENLVKSYGPSIHISEDYSDGVAFAILIIILILRPTGLFGRGVVEKV
jgi:branched-chain amino acid transport system permease protein